MATEHPPWLVGGFSPSWWSQISWIVSRYGSSYLNLVYLKLLYPKKYGENHHFHNQTGRFRECAPSAIVRHTQASYGDIDPKWSQYISMLIPQDFVGEILASLRVSAGRLLVFRPRPKLNGRGLKTSTPQNVMVEKCWKHHVPIWQCVKSLYPWWTSK